MQDHWTVNLLINCFRTDEFMQYEEQKKNRKDNFGSDIVKGGMHKIVFADNPEV